MPFWRLYYHLVWATDERRPLIEPVVEKRLYAYLVAKAAELGVFVYAVNGWYDHVHLVVAIPPHDSVADVVKRLKGASSHDLNHAGGLEGSFAWQRGYGALSLGDRQRPAAEIYVNRQKQHHTEQTIHPWLERYTELDEGPENAGLPSDGVPPAVREAASGYQALGESPF